MARVLYCLIALALFLVTPTFAADIRVGNYKLDVTFYPGTSRMQGTAWVWFASGSDGSPIPSAYLHGELRVDSVLLGKKAVSFGQEPTWYDHNYSLTAIRLQIDSTTRITDEPLVIYYRGPIHASAARSRSDYMRIAPDGVYLRAYGYSLWFPVFLESGAQEYEADFDTVTIRVPADYVAVFAGQSLSQTIDSAAAQSTWTWRAMNLSLHAAQCAALPGMVMEQGSVCVYCRTDQSSRNAAGNVLSFAADLQRRYTDWYCAPAIMSQLHLIQMPPYGDISSANVVGLSDEVWSAFDTLNWAKGALAHELIHPYVRPAISNDDSLAAVVIEGFPSYLHWPILGELWGEDWYADRMKRTEEEYLNKLATGTDRWGKLPPNKPLITITADEVGEYKDRFLLDDRALLMLHDLYRRMGKTRFRAFMHEVCSASPLSLRRFESLCLRYVPAMGADLDLWLRSTEYPERLRLRL